ncbi:MAG: hypothetical protein ABL958_08880 [Bdellovibrionia bacterium]
MFSLIGLLWPSYLAQWAGFIFVVAVCWRFLARTHVQFPFKWKSAFVVATGFWLCFVTNSLVNYYQSGVINAAVGEARSQQQASQGQQQAAPTDPNQLKSNFLADVDTLAQNPAQLTPEIKQKLFTVYAPLFPNGKTDVDTAFKAVDLVYQCQRYFWEDAMASYKAKVVIKSDARKDCEKLSGAFFNRERLLSAEVVKRNDDLIKAFSERKRVPASDGKEVEFNESNIRQSLDAQVKASENLQRIFR